MNIISFSFLAYLIRRTLGEILIMVNNDLKTDQESYENNIFSNINQAMGKVSSNDNYNETYIFHLKATQSMISHSIEDVYFIEEKNIILIGESEKSKVAISFKSKGIIIMGAKSTLSVKNIKIIIDNPNNSVYSIKSKNDSLVDNIRIEVKFLKKN